MSRKDVFHELVKELLMEEGWTITHDPYIFQTRPLLSIDLAAERAIAAERDSEKIAVEIKSFLGVSQMVELEKALGQYLLYERLLERQEPERELYLAVPKHAYENVFATEVGQIAVTQFALRLIVFSVAESEVLQWIEP
jgi:hypothetical protein